MDDLSSTKLISFIQKAVSPYHAVQAAVEELVKDGFERIDFQKKWLIKPGGSYFMTHHDSSLIAFHIGENITEEAIFRIAAAHTDFPCLRVKPAPDMYEEGYAKINVEVYGGAILNTWLDRPLSVAGKVALKGKDVFQPDIQFVDVKVPVFTIPNLAVHLNKDINKGTELNKQVDMIPIAGIIEKEEKYFMPFLAKKLGCTVEDILDYDLTVYIAEHGEKIGIAEEFISAPRLDNMTSVQAIIEAITGVKGNNQIQVAALFDHEEVGSKTKQGAGSVLLSLILEKIELSLGKTHTQYLETMIQSFMLSVDVAHGYHPNQGGKYDPVNKAVLGSGITIKASANQSYATDCESIACIQQLCEEHEIPYKKFVNRSDGTSGGTLGTIATTQLPMHTVDIGVPLLAMHSARELMGTMDQCSLVKLLKTFYS